MVANRVNCIPSHPHRTVDNAKILAVTLVVKHYEDTEACSESPNVALSWGLNIIDVLSNPAGWFFFWEGLGWIFFRQNKHYDEYLFYKKMCKSSIRFVAYKETK